MNQEETKRRLNCLEADCKNLSTEINILKAKLAEKPEKPKLRHGDFGTNYGFKRIVINDMIYNEHGEIVRSANDPARKNSKGIWFGNIFDIMKDWDKDLEEFEIIGAGKALLKVRIACDKKSFIFMLYDGLKSLPIVISIPAEEIWYKFGQMIITPKRKQS